MATKSHNRIMFYKPLTKVSGCKSKMEKYTFIKEIGSGGFGKVFLVKSKQEGINYVVKKIDLTKLDRKQTLLATKEVELLSKFRHNNIVSYKESYEKNNELNIVLEYCEKGDLHNKIKEKRMSNEFFSENEIFDYFVQISLALEYIHSHKILHRDLKTKNIFLTKGNIIKLGDFGIAKTLENSFELAQTFIGSPFYLSPEICESKPYNKKSDVWALGCVLYELSTLRYAFVARNVKTLISKILAGAYNPLPANMNIHIRSLISCMLKPNPVDRPSVREILGKQFLIKRRATFICKAYGNDFCKRRPKHGGGRNFHSAVFKNTVQKNDLNIYRLSLSCLQLNEGTQRSLNNISHPQEKYNRPTNCRNLKVDKKSVLVTSTKNEIDKTLFKAEKEEQYKFELNKRLSDLKNPEMPGEDKFNNKNSIFESIKSIKLPKANSQYYNLIAGNDQNEDALKKNDDFVGKQITDHDFNLININSKPDIFKMQKILKNSPLVNEEFEQSGDLPQTDLKKAKTMISANIGPEHRKRWLKNTFQREALLAVFSESELLECCVTNQLIEGEPKKATQHQSLDDIFTVNHSGINHEGLQPLRPSECESKAGHLKIDYLELLQHEVNHLREKFELNNQIYQVEDLMRLTNNSKNILKLEGLQKCAEHDAEMGESVYFDLECLRMSLEQKIGFWRFSQTYEKMLDIINDEFNSNLKNCLESQFDPTKTYVIKKVQVAGDSDDLMKNIWKSIIGILGDKQEYLPDVWELAMYENIFYHL